jgi:hypothetical protein
MGFDRFHSQISGFSISRSLYTLRHRWIESTFPPGLPSQPFSAEFGDTSQRHYMVPKNPLRPDDHESGSSAGEVKVGSGSSGERPVPDSWDAPTLLDISSDTKSPPSNSLPSSNSVPSNADSPTFVDLGTSVVTRAEGTDTTMSSPYPQQFSLTPGMPGVKGFRISDTS